MVDSTVKLYYSNLNLFHYPFTLQLLYTKNCILMLKNNLLQKNFHLRDKLHHSKFISNINGFMIYTHIKYVFTIKIRLLKLNALKVYKNIWDPKNNKRLSLNIQIFIDGICLYVCKRKGIYFCRKSKWKVFICSCFDIYSIKAKQQYNILIPNTYNTSHFTQFKIYIWT